jgi:hypothetical protein
VFDKAVKINWFALFGGGPAASNMQDFHSLFGPGGLSSLLWGFGRNGDPSVALQGVGTVRIRTTEEAN